ncbi:hypothetical protein VTN77DRAFT_6271 [Rasamsonia byssochlamydoides]|uniref:uncharacterized protein n=1 Tax=Rasamsonia byssochlamydoides TaxID=89139 RepID=UPI003743A0A0
MTSGILIGYLNALELRIDIPWDSFKDAYQYCRDAHVHKPDAYGEELLPDEEDPFEELEIDNADHDIQQSWAGLAAQLPAQDNATRLEDPDNLG